MNSYKKPKFLVAKNSKCSLKLISSVLALATLAFLLFVVVGIYMSHVEHPKYEVLQTDSMVEIRHYQPIIVAEVNVQLDRKLALQQGFHKLAAYISGSNHTKHKIHMTAPVMQEPNTNSINGNSWKIRFMMPSQYTLSTLPKPNHRDISLRMMQAHKYIVIKFSGNNSNHNIKEHFDKLENFIATNKLQVKGHPIISFYNPPWVFPLMKKNEIMIKLR